MNVDKFLFSIIVHCIHWPVYASCLYTVGVTVILNATAAGFGVATGPVLIDETRCIGNETRLINCRHNGIGTHNCAHSRDVGLRCAVRKLDVTSNLHPSVHLQLSYRYSLQAIQQVHAAVAGLIISI